MKIILLIIAMLFASSPSYGLFKKTVTVGPEDRPAELKLPRFYKESKQYPLVLLLHGRGNDANTTDLYLGLSRNQDQLGYALLLPNGTNRPSDGQRMWNATEDCCADDNSVDDVGYLTSLMQEVTETYSIDEDRLFVIGHSNGGFMSYRLACDTEGLFRGVVSVAGSTFAKEDQCRTQTPINVLQIHGTLDSTVPYDGANKNYPGAFETAARWAERNQCASFEENLLGRNLLFFEAEPVVNDDGSIGIDGNIFDLSFEPETDEFRYFDCAEDRQVGLWKINDANHVPVFLGRNVIRQALEFVGYKK